MEAVVLPQGVGLRGSRTLKEEEEAPLCDAFGGQLVVVEGTHAGFGGAWPPQTAAVANNGEGGGYDTAAGGGGGGVGRRKRRRRRDEERSKINEEKAENQRMNHIAVERNRRKQMNDYLAVLQSLMPPSYVARGDQASIVGGAINFVKELEQLLQSLEAHKQIALGNDAATAPSSSSDTGGGGGGAGRRNHGEGVAGEATFVADNYDGEDSVEVVSVVERHANLKVVARRQRRRPRQLLRMVVGLQNLRLTPLHLSLTSVAQMAFYSFSVKVEDDCRLVSTEDIASAVHRMVRNIRGDDEYCDAIIM